jgi:hypothetical protein
LYTTNSLTFCTSSVILLPGSSAVTARRTCAFKHRLPSMMVRYPIATRVWDSATESAWSLLAHVLDLQVNTQ